MSKHTPLIKKLPFTREFYSYCSKVNPDDGVMISFETGNKEVFNVRLHKSAAKRLCQWLTDVCNDWEEAQESEEKRE